MGLGVASGWLVSPVLSAPLGGLSAMPSALVVPGALHLVCRVGGLGPSWHPRLLVEVPKILLRRRRADARWSVQQQPWEQEPECPGSGSIGGGLGCQDLVQTERQSCPHPSSEEGAAKKKVLWRNVAIRSIASKVASAWRGTVSRGGWAGRLAGWLSAGVLGRGPWGAGSDGVLDVLDEFGLVVLCWTRCQRLRRGLVVAGVWTGGWLRWPPSVCTVCCLRGSTFAEVALEQRFLCCFGSRCSGAPGGSPG